MTDLSKMTSEEVEQYLTTLKQAKRQMELVQLANTINTSEYAMRIEALPDKHLVYLYAKGTTDLLYSVVNAKDWDSIKNLCAAMLTPSQFELDELELEYTDEKDLENMVAQAEIDYHRAVINE